MTQTYTVYGGVEMPAARRSSRRGSKYPFGSLKVGEMFFIPAAEVPKSFSSQRNAAQRRYNSKFSARHIVLDGVEGLGCWRTE
jgi:hypothetical protein